MSKTPWVGMPWRPADPLGTILVELEEGPLFVSNPSGFSWKEITPDMPVKVAFLDCEDSAGPFSLPVFAQASARANPP
jgi:hypothetical protein